MNINDNLKEFYKIRENYDAYRFNHAIRMLSKMQLLVYKMFDYDENLINNHNDYLKNIYLSNKDKIPNVGDLNSDEYQVLKESFDKINNILESNGLSINMMPYLEFSDYLNYYPIAISEVNKEYSFKENT
jgi:hypothetical protein